jgi:hypothetical protein
MVRAHFLALTLPSREHPRYAEALALMREHGFVLEPSNRKWWLRDRHKALNFLATQLTRLRTTFDAEFTDNFERNTANLKVAEVAAEITPAGGDFSVTLGLRAGSADESTVRSAVAANRGYIEADGQVYLIDASRVAKLATAQRALGGDPHAPLAPRKTVRVSGARTVEAQEIIEALSPDFQPPETWRERSQALRELNQLAPAPMPRELDALLRPYQRLGAAWMWHLYRHQFGAFSPTRWGSAKRCRPSPCCPP